MAHRHRYLSALAIVGMVTIAAPACAQTYGYGGYGRYPDRNYGREVEKRAYERGYREGLDDGRDDARHDRRFAYDRHHEYRDADDGYHRDYGDREFYRRSYRQGFQAGYNESYNRFARNDRGRYDYRR
jgi:hypothetical protein